MLTIVMLSCYTECHYPVCHYALRLCAECHFTEPFCSVLLCGVVMLSAVGLNVTAPLQLQAGYRIKRLAIIMNATDVEENDQLNVLKTFFCTIYKFVW